MPGFTATLGILFAKALALSYTSLLSRGHMLLPLTAPSLCLPEKEEAAIYPLVAKQMVSHKVHISSTNACGSFFQRDETKQSFLSLERFPSAQS